MWAALRRSPPKFPHSDRSPPSSSLRFGRRILRALQPRGARIADSASVCLAAHDRHHALALAACFLGLLGRPVTTSAHRLAIVPPRRDVLDLSAVGARVLRREKLRVAALADPVTILAVHELSHPASRRSPRSRGSLCSLARRRFGRSSIGLLAAQPRHAVDVDHADLKIEQDTRHVAQQSTLRRDSRPPRVFLERG